MDARHHTELHPGYGDIPATQICTCRYQQHTATSSNGLIYLFLEVYFRYSCCALSCPRLLTTFYLLCRSFFFSIHQVLYFYWKAYIFLWTFSEVLEPVALVPQLLVFRGCKDAGRLACKFSSTTSYSGCACCWHWKALKW